MKTLFKNIIKVSVLAMVVSFGASAMAAGFSMNPGYGDPNAAGNTNFTSVNNYRGNGANQTDDLHVSIPNPGDSEDIYVFLDFWNDVNSYGGGTISNARGHITYPSLNTVHTDSSITFTGNLTGGNANPGNITDTTRISGLPSKWELTFVDGVVDIDEHYSEPGHVACSDYVGVYLPRENPFTNPSNVLIGNLHDYCDGWGEQGFVIAHFKITNREQATPVYVYVWHYSNWDWGPCVNNLQEGTRTATCYNETTNTPVSDSYCSGTPETTTTRNCTSNLSVQTVNAAVGTSSVAFRGEVVGGTTNHAYFVYSLDKDDTSIYCDPNMMLGIPLYVTGSQSGLFTGNFSPLPTDSGTYWYRACIEDGIGPHQGILKSYTITHGTNPSETPEAETLGYDNVTKHSADVDGRVKMNNINDGRVFFVYGEDESLISSVSSDYNKYSEVPDGSDNINKIEVDNNNDQNSWKLYGNVHLSGLDADETIYYRICVQYREDDGTGPYRLECGNVRDFDTDSDSQSASVDIRTLPVDSYGKTAATICGDLVDNGGDSSIRTWMEYRKASSTSSYSKTHKVNRGETNYCDTVRGLTPNTRYAYRACADGGYCGNIRYFTTKNSINNGQKPEVTTGNATDYPIYAHNAKLPGIYVSHADRATVWFRYGRSTVLNKTTRKYVKTGAGGLFIHNFTNLKANQRYCYQAVIETVNGTDTGAVKCFYTKPAYNPGPAPKPKPIEVVVPDNEPDIDLSRLGLGLSLIRLEIDDNRETVQKGESVTYEVRWENISDINLNNIDLNVEIPREIQITSTSRGVLDQDRNAIFYTIDRLDAGEKNSMTVTGVVVDGNLGDALTAEATTAFDNPINQAKENATDYDVDEFTVLTALGTASVFGLGNITLLGWLTILLGLFIVFLVARWLYLEREELRAQAYVNGYGRTPYMAPVDNRYDYIPAPQAPVRDAHYVEPVAPVAPTQPSTSNNTPSTGERTDYRPYRPNRG